MKKFLVLAAAFLAAGSADAGWRRGRSVAVAEVSCATCPAASTSTAQGAAVVIASSGRFRHVGGNRGAEGIGLGATAAEAIRNCCFYGRLQAVEIGTAQMRSGQFVAVVRYR